MTLRVELTTRQEEYRIDAGVLLVPETSTDRELNDLVRHMLGTGEDIKFVFRLGDRVLHGDLASLLGEAGLSREEVCQITYELPEDAPRPDRQISEPDWIRCVAVSPRGRILTGSFDRLVRLYEANAENPRCFQGSSDTITAVAWINETRFAAGSADGLIHIFSEALGAPEQVLKSHEQAIQSILVVGDLIYSADFGGHICVFSTLSSAASAVAEPAKGKEEGKKGKGRKRQQQQQRQRLMLPVQMATRTWQTHKGTIAGLLSEDAASTTLLSFGWDGCIHRWQMPEGLLCGSWQAPLTISAVGIGSIDDAPILTGHSDGSIRIWNLQSPSNPLVEVRKGAHDGWISAVALDPSNRDRFATAGSDGKVLLWDRRDLAKPLSSLREAVVGGPTKHEAVVGRPTKCEGAVGRPTKCEGAVGRPTKCEGAVGRPTKCEGAVGRPTKVLCLDWLGAVLAYGGEDKLLCTCRQ